MACDLGIYKGAAIENEKKNQIKCCTAFIDESTVEVFTFKISTNYLQRPLMMQGRGNIIFFFQFFPEQHFKETMKFQIRAIYWGREKIGDS